MRNERETDRDTERRETDTKRKRKRDRQTETNTERYTDRTSPVSARLAGCLYKTAQGSHRSPSRLTKRE